MYAKYPKTAQSAAVFMAVVDKRFCKRWPFAFRKATFCTPICHLSASVLRPFAMLSATCWLSMIYMPP